MKDAMGVEKEKYFNSTIIRSNLKVIDMDEDKHNKYLSIISRIPFIYDNNNEIVQMNLKQVNDSIYFNGLVAKELSGGYAINGVIRLQEEVISINVDFDNNNKYEQFIVKFDEIKKERRK